MSISIQHSAIIKMTFDGGKRAHTWLSNTRSVPVHDGEDMVFVQLDKWERGFVKFVTGKGLTFKTEDHEANNVNCKFLDTLQKLRTRAANKAFSDAIAANENGDDDEPKHKKPRRNAHRDDEAIIDDTVLTLQLPELVNDDGAVIANSVTLKVLWGVKNDVVWIELKEDNLQYIRHGILQSLARGEVGRHWER